MAQAVEHVTQREGEYYVTGTRVPVGVVIAAWKQGSEPKEIPDQFQSLSLADVYGTISFYLDNQTEMDAHFAALEEEFARASQLDRERNPHLYARVHAYYATHHKPEETAKS